MTKTLFLFPIAALLLVSSVAAQGEEWTSDPYWVQQALDRFNAFQNQTLRYNWWVPHIIEPCVFAERAYPDGTVYRTIWGIVGHRWDGSPMCYIPRRGGGQAPPPPEPVYVPPPVMPEPEPEPDPEPEVHCSPNGCWTTDPYEWLCNYGECED